MSKVACSACGAAILTATAEVTSALCMPCKPDRRYAIEAGRRRLQGERARRAHPLTRHWHDLVHRVHQMPQGFAGLSEPEKLYYAVGTLDGAIYRGGFESYFFNTSGGHYEYALS